MSGIDAARQLPIQLALVTLAFLYFAWIGLLAGAFSAAVAIDGLGGGRIRRFAATVARLGRLDLLSAAFLEVGAIALLVLFRARYPSMVQTGGFWAAALLPLAGGLGLLGFYAALLEADRWRPGRTLVGLLGVAFIVSSSWVLVSGASVMLQPETWPADEPFYVFLPTYSGMGRFGELTLLSFAATGVLIAWAGGRVEEEAVTRFARRFGGGTTLVAVLAWPLAILFTHANLPTIALSPPLWGVAAAAIALAGGTAGLVLHGLGGAVAPRTRPLVVAVGLLLALLVVSDHLTRERVQQPEILAGVVAPPAVPPKPAAPPEETGRLAAGKAVYDRVCNLCHRFDVRLVGPPFDETIPKYRKDPAALEAYIRHPVKKDPGYPEMPRPDVTEEEIHAVAAYLLAKAAP